MEYITLKNTDVKVSRFCMGGCPMGGYGWGKTNEQEFIDAIHIALDNGVNFFDTANTYGLGQSEKTLAKGIAGHRQEVVIQSKFGVRVMQDMVGTKTVHDNSAGYIRKALEGTLERLGTDYVDIYTIHYRDRSTPIADVVGTLEMLRAEGKVRYFGLSNICANEVEELRAFKGKFVSCQNELSLACRDNEESLRTIANQIGVSPMTWGSLGQGILTGKYGKNVKFDSSDRRSKDVYINFHGDKLEQNLRIVDALRKVSGRYDRSISACAIRFILDYLPDSVVIAGVKRPSQMRDNLGAMDWELSEDEIRTLDKVSRQGADSGKAGQKGVEQPWN